MTDDKKLFNEAMSEVNPIKPSLKRSVLERKPNTNTKKHFDQQEEPDPSQLSLMQLENHQAQKYFMRSGLSSRHFKKLRRGELAIEAEIDLHRLTINEAEQASREFIQSCQSGSLLCIKIIHGKGLHSPKNSITLYTMIRYLLTQIDSVLAYSTAPPKEGGDGAVLVLLKRRKDHAT